MITVEMIGHVLITLVAVTGLAVRIEHRITKIETDTKWIKENCTYHKQGEKNYDGDS